MGSASGDGPTYRGPTEEPSPPVDRLRAALAGEVRADAYSRHLWATDASLYREVPVAVAFPRSRADVIAAVEICQDHDVALLPRGAGTSLAGQAVNDAVVLDCSRHLTTIESIDPATRTATVQPGVVLDDLNARVRSHDLQFGPDPAWGAYSTIGGAIANNSAGAHSLAYGATDADLEAVEVVFADATVASLEAMTPAAIAATADPDGDARDRLFATVDRFLREEADTIEAAYPDLHRNVAGYNLAAVLEPDDEGRINLARLIAASEGTLGIVTEATVSLVERPAAVGAALLSYAAYETAMADVAGLVKTDPAAVECLDAAVLDVARDHPTFAEVAAIPPASAEGVLLVEYVGESASAVANRLEETAERFGPDAGEAIAVRLTTDEAERERFWSLRKSALPLLLSETRDAKHVAFVEDTAVPPAALPAYVEGLRSILDDHDTTASLYGHAGPGVLHVRPLIDTVALEGREQLRSIAEAVFELVQDHDGSIAGEHGDGRARTEWTQRQYGPAVVDLFRELKASVDPAGRMNPGPIVGDVDLTTHHRIDPDAEATVPFEPALHWPNDNGVRGMIELCHGCGGCTGDAGAEGIMCPTYRATGEEIAATRGRANLLREAIRGHLEPETLFDPRFEAEVLDLCIGCKGCLRDCPSGVDLATLKVELRHQRHRRRGPTRRERLFGSFPRLADLASRVAPVSNWLASMPGADAVGARLLGVTPERAPPRFASTPFSAAVADRPPQVDTRATPHRAVILPDPYTDHLHPEVGHATLRVLEAAGVHVEVATDAPPPGRAAYSQGFVERAREQAAATRDQLEGYVDDGWAVVVPEPSAAAMVQSDYANLLGPATAESLAEATYTPVAYLDAIDLDPPVAPGDDHVVLHRHCHGQSVGATDRTAPALAELGYGVTEVDSGCCGMAGSFGYEAEHYDLSVQMGSILVDQLAESPDGVVLAAGSSCREQLAHLEVERPVRHPIAQLDADRV